MPVVFILRQLDPYNVTKSANMSAFFGVDNFDFDNVCVTQFLSSPEAILIGNWNGSMTLILYDMDTHKWQFVGPLYGVEVRDSPSCATKNGSLYVFGGYNPNTGRTTRDIFALEYGAYNASNLTDEFGETLEEARTDSQAHVVGNQIWIIGGSDVQATFDGNGTVGK